MFKKFHSCIVLDIDETLIHSTQKSLEDLSKIKSSSYDKCFKMDKQYYCVKFRPYLKEFLESAFKNFDHVAIWTAADRKYATKILNYILTPKQFDSLLFFYSRRDCVKDNQGYDNKPLEKIFNKYRFLNKKNTVIVDNATYITRLNKNMSINVPDFISSNNDIILKNLITKYPVSSERSMKLFINRLSKLKK